MQSLELAQMPQVRAPASMSSPNDALHVTVTDVLFNNTHMLSYIGLSPDPVDSSVNCAWAPGPSTRQTEVQSPSSVLSAVFALPPSWKGLDSLMTDQRSVPWEWRLRTLTALSAVPGLLIWHQYQVCRDIQAHPGVDKNALIPRIWLLPTSLKGTPQPSGLPALATSNISPGIPASFTAKLSW